MEDWMKWVLWFAVTLSAALALRYVRMRMRPDREDREPLEARPLLPADKMAVLRPGDTVLMMPSLDDMTTDQQVAMIGSMKAMIEPARERGIEFIIIPDRRQKAVVVSKGTPGQGLEDVQMPGPRLPPPPNPRPNPPDSGLNDEQWMQFLARQRAETVQIDPIPKTYKECFFNRGVFMALEAVFRSPKPLYSRDSREYAEMVWAFWELAPYFGEFWPDNGAESSDG